MEKEVKRENADASLLIILITLGVCRDRAETLDKKKMSLIQKWTGSISTYIKSDMTEPYRFP